MPQDPIRCIATELGLAPGQVAAASALLDEGATIPFIARYRKERTGSLNEVSIASIRDRLRQLRSLEERRSAILSSLQERDLLTESLRTAVEKADTMASLEDVYLPYRPKRRTRATIAREKGLEPLADLLIAQESDSDPLVLAAAYVDAERDVSTPEDALAGARDILAERINEDASARDEIRRLFMRRAMVISSVVEGRQDSGATYRDYFDWQEPLARVPAHRLLAVLRAEREGIVRLAIRPDEDAAVSYLKHRVVHGSAPVSDQVARAAEDAYKRLVAPSIENEIRAEWKKRADREAVRVFAENVERLLMAPPLGRKRILAIDPGYRTGGKVVCLDAQGKLLTHAVIHPVGSETMRASAIRALQDLVIRHEIEAIAIGNGTASRETEALVRSIDFGREIPVLLVNESGASVYSASEIGRRELPDEDVTVRGAVSIGRRLADPLAELVKIDPKSIGVGQYQHDVDQGLLRQALDDVVERCVNAVGVDVNTASVSLLAHVSGLGPHLAERLVDYRDEHGAFETRASLTTVPRLGPKAFEQAAGFLRVQGGPEPLDASAVHPERYPLVRRMAQDLGCRVEDLMTDAQLRKQIDLPRYVTDEVGMPTLEDIVQELAKPGRDPRAPFSRFSFSDQVHGVGDLRPGMTLPGVVTNVVDFGAFVDIGVHQDGLVHVSQLDDRYIEHPSDVVHAGQTVVVTVLDVDAQRRRISLSMKRNAPRSGRNKAGEA